MAPSIKYANNARLHELGAMNRRLTLRIRLVYAIGAAADAGVGFVLLFPEALSRLLGLARVPSNPSERLALAIAATMLLGWAALLFWAAKSPVERRGVLQLTIFPVIAGLALSVFFGWRMSYIPAGAAATIWSLQALLVGLLAWASRAARRVVSQTGARP
jgi:nitric oxide reductase large subunit